MKLEMETSKLCNMRLTSGMVFMKGENVIRITCNDYIQPKSIFLAKNSITIFPSNLTLNQSLPYLMPDIMHSLLRELKTWSYLPLLLLPSYFQ